MTALCKQIGMGLRLLPVVLEELLVPGSFAHAVHHLVDQLGLSRFDSPYRNDRVGSCGYSPSTLLKAILLAYSQGGISSRGIERACRENVVFVAITGDAKPHFTTIADLISGSPARNRLAILLTSSCASAFCSCTLSCRLGRSRSRSTYLI